MIMTKKDLFNMIHSVLVCSSGTSYPSSVGLECYFPIGTVKHSGGYTVPYIGHGVVADGQIELGEFLIESIEPVIECPKGFTSLGSSKHILCTSLGNGIPQCRVDGYKFRGRLYVEVVHRHGGNDTLRIVGHRFSQVTEIDEDAYTVII